MNLKKVDSNHSVKREGKIFEKMRKSILSKYTDPKNKEVFEKHETLYSKKIFTKFKGLKEEGLETDRFYFDYFKDFKLKSADIVKFTSKLKHKCYEFSNKMEGLSKSIQEIRELFSQMVNTINYMHTKYNFHKDLEVTDVKII